MNASVKENRFRCAIILKTHENSQVLTRSKKRTSPLCNLNGRNPERKVSLRPVSINIQCERKVPPVCHDLLLEGNSGDAPMK